MKMTAKSLRHVVQFLLVAGACISFHALDGAADETARVDEQVWQGLSDLGFFTMPSGRTVLRRLPSSDVRMSYSVAISRPLAAPVLLDTYLTDPKFADEAHQFDAEMKAIPAQITALFGDMISIRTASERAIPIYVFFMADESVGGSSSGSIGYRDVLEIMTSCCKRADPTNPFLDACISDTELDSRPLEDNEYSMNGNLGGGNLYINLDAEPSRLERCVNLEIYRMAGLFGHISVAVPSIFQLDGPSGVPTDFDKSVLKMLYTRNLAPGLSKADALLRLQAHCPPPSAKEDPILDELRRKLSGESC